MASMRNWIKDDGRTNDGKRVVVVHCKAGKGRSGTVACSYLMSEEGWKLSDALTRFTQKRMRAGFGDGISIPSQLRYVGYVDRWVRHSKIYVERQIEILEVHVWGMRDGVKVAVESFVDEGKIIKTFHVFSKEERMIVDSGTKRGGAFADLAGVKNESREPKSKTIDSSAGISSSSTSSATTIQHAGDEPGGGAIIFKPRSRVVLPSNDINIDFERRNKAVYGWTMVTSVAHVWFNAFFEGSGPENAGIAATDGVFEIQWEAMDGIKGSSKKGVRALDRMAVLWRALDGDKEGIPQIITEPKLGEPVPEAQPADWKHANEENPQVGNDLGLRTEGPISRSLSKASSIKSGKTASQLAAQDESNSVFTSEVKTDAHKLGSSTNDESRNPNLQPHSDAGNSKELESEIKDSGLANVANAVGGMRHISTEDLPDGKPSTEMKTSKDMILGTIVKEPDLL